VYLLPAHRADAVAQMGAVKTARAANQAMVDGEDHRVALIRRAHFDAGLPAQLLLGSLAQRRDEIQLSRAQIVRFVQNNGLSMLRGQKKFYLDTKVFSVKDQVLQSHIPQNWLCHTQTLLRVMKNNSQSVSAA
jgi:hypothetical protein